MTSKKSLKLLTCLSTMGDYISISFFDFKPPIGGFFFGGAQMCPILYWHEMSENPIEQAERDDRDAIGDAVPVFDRGGERPWSRPFRGPSHELDFND